MIVVLLVGIVVVVRSLQSGKLAVSNYESDASGAPAAQVILANTTSASRFPSVRAGDYLKYTIQTIPNTKYAICMNGTCSGGGYQTRTISGKVYVYGIGPYGTDGKGFATAPVAVASYSGKGNYSFYTMVYPDGGTPFKSNTVIFSVN